MKVWRHATIRQICQPKVLFHLRSGAILSKPHTTDTSKEFHIWYVCTYVWQCQILRTNLSVVGYNFFFFQKSILFAYTFFKVQLYSTVIWHSKHTPKQDLSKIKRHLGTLTSSAVGSKPNCFFFLFSLWTFFRARFFFQWSQLFELLFWH